MKTRLLAFLLLGAVQVGNLSCARAQSNVVPPEFSALLNDVNDIDKLRVINPLKLKGDQLDLLLSTLKAYQIEYNKALADAIVPPLKELAKDIKETRVKMLKGDPIPSDLDEKV